MAAARSGRLVSTVNGVVALGLVVAVAAVALVVKPPAPPGIAEFAPNATQVITKAPPGQAAAHGGDGSAACAGFACASSPTPTPTPSASAAVRSPNALTGVPSALQCYTWPDGSVTQTGDPQSPPCIADWPERVKGNGGATTRGVTATEIRVAVPTLSLDASRQAEVGEDVLAMERFFNSHFQFYGRQLRLLKVASPSDTSPEAQKAAALAVGELRPFAASDLLKSNDWPVYRRELVRQKIVSLTAGALSVSRDELRRSGPYLWSFGPTVDVVQRGFVEFACKNLQGTADYAGPGTVGKPRRFAVVRQPQVPASVQEELAAGLASCTGEQPFTAELSSHEKSNCGGADDSATRQLVSELRASAVTTVVLLMDSGLCLHKAAGPAYQPEWAVVPFNFHSYAEWTQEGGVKEHLANTFGIASSNKWLPRHDEPAFRAVTASLQKPRAWSHAGYWQRKTYQELLMLASGIQMAGPQLTPQTFSAALEGTQFPNPGAAGPPYYQASVGFAPDDHAFVEDFGVWWWNPTVDDAAQTTSETGGFCYVQRGRRWQPGLWPSGLKLKEGTCR